ncbi:MAG: nucleotidyltransferase domain-containing protein [Proteobacteria bacterium]|nr:nucleotidyltransferase domain-containing protein [Desulfobulbaceae bacterium]MBU4151627.1 nucleotidyltransferase domain-containing protein [Pseudomonadota bacterium]
MNRKDRSIAKHFKKLLLKKITPVDVRVFGSRARGDSTPDSDLDMFIVVEHTTHEIEKYISNCAWEAGFEQNIVIVPVVVVKDKLRGSVGKSAFIHNVYREGIVV